MMRLAAPSRAALLLSLGATVACFVAPYPAHALSPNIQLTNCDDSGAGSLRQALLDIADGGTIDATHLLNVCQKIYVESDQLSFGGDNLTIVGPGADQLAITTIKPAGSTVIRFTNRIFLHTGRGTLALKNLTLVGGNVTTTTAQAMAGGCIQSSANVSLNGVVVQGCSVYSPIEASGGCIQAAGTVTLTSATLQSCTVTSQQSQANGGCLQSGGNVTLSASRLDGCTVTTSAQAIGGGLQSNGTLTMNQGSHVDNNLASGTAYGAIGGGLRAARVTLQQSTVAGNTALGGGGSGSVVEGGGIATSGTSSMIIIQSTISGNSASGGRLTGGADTASGGGAYLTGAVTLSESTISGNSAGYDAGARINASGISMVSNTIAFNHATAETATGVRLSSQGGIQLNNNLVSNNTVGTEFAANDVQITGTTSPTGTANLVFASSSPLPTGTLRDTCPLLAPLASNGGSTQTHALYSHSPALDVGSQQGLTVDQRGAPRPSGAGTDIGSYEVQVGDEVFGTGFDGC